MALSLLKSNQEFQNIGYFYSENLSNSIIYNPDGKILESNGLFYFNSAKNLTLLDLTCSIKSRELNKFPKN